MNYTNMNVQMVPETIYDIKNTHVYLLEAKTNVRYDEDLEKVIINKLMLSESMSIRFKYTLGSLNFLFEEVSEKIIDNSKRNTMLDQIILLFKNLNDKLRDVKSENNVEKLIDFLNKEKRKIKLRIPSYL